MPASLATVYCTRTEVEAILSSAGVMARLDDGTSNSAAQAVAVIEQASETVNIHCCRRYAVAALATSPWVKWATATIAARNACRRRANPVPGAIEQDYDEVMEKLKQILSAQLDLPNIAPAHDETPAVSNYTIDSRFHRSKIRRVWATSTGGSQDDTRKQNNSIDIGPFP